jgi:transaldolase
MKIFIDTANVDEIKKAQKLGLVDGVTTNPTLLAKEKGDREKIIRSVCEVVKGPVHVEITSLDTAQIMEEGRTIAKWAPNIVIKIPLNHEGLVACHMMREEGIRSTMTLIFTTSQAILAAKAGAAYICPFIGRLDDISTNGLDLVREIREIYGRYPEIKTEIVVASVRHPIHVVESARCGAHVITISFNILKQMEQHPLTDKGIETFLSDAKKAIIRKD